MLWHSQTELGVIVVVVAAARVSLFFKAATLHLSHYHSPRSAWVEVVEKQKKVDIAWQETYGGTFKADPVETRASSSVFQSE